MECGVEWGRERECFKRAREGEGEKGRGGEGEGEGHLGSSDLLRPTGQWPLGSFSAELLVSPAFLGVVCFEGPRSHRTRSLVTTCWHIAEALVNRFLQCSWG